MKTPVRYFLAILVIGLGTALWATSPETSKHFVVTNNVKRSVPNTGTVLTLGGTHAKPSLQETATLSTNVVTLRGVPGNPNVFAISHGPDVCFFLSEPQNPGNEISAFVYPGFTLEGNYNDPSVTNSNFGISLAARGNFLFASYGDNISYTGNLAVWRIRSGCALELHSTSSTQYPIGSLAVSPDGKTLVVTYAGGSGNEAGSFSISSDGKLTEHGPYGVDSASSLGGIDITADSKYALFAVTGVYPMDLTTVSVIAINSDGSLGNQYESGEYGSGIGTNSIRLSPNGKFIFVNDNQGIHITTLNFSENPVSITWSGCYTTVRVPRGVENPTGSGIATVFPTGSGGGLYLAEGFKSAYIALLDIDTKTGCLTEASTSPFSLGEKNFGSLATWPPRPF
jgi:hypothetical protein